MTDPEIPNCPFTQHCTMLAKKCSTCLYVLVPREKSYYVKMAPITVEINKTLEEE